MPVANLKVVYRDPRKLIVNPRNTRTHSPEQIAGIRTLMRKFGVTNPLLLKDDDAMIGAGHGRFEAIMGFLTDGEAIPGCADGKVPTISLYGLSDAEWRAYAIADNKIALSGASWNLENLRLELGDLRALDFDLSLSAFNPEELGSVFLDRLVGENDAAAEWQGMPEFDQKDKTAFRSMPVHFPNQKAVDAFAKLIGQPITDQTRFVWYPKAEIETYADKRWTSGPKADDVK